MSGGADAPVATLWVLLTALFHREPATRAGNPGFARGSKPVAEVYTAARAVEWLIRETETKYQFRKAHFQTLNYWFNRNIGITCAVNMPNTLFVDSSFREHA